MDAKLEKFLGTLSELLVCIQAAGGNIATFRWDSLKVMQASELVEALALNNITFTYKGEEAADDELRPCNFLKQDSLKEETLSQGPNPYEVLETLKGEKISLPDEGGPDVELRR